MKWIDDIIDVLKTSDKAMHYVDIAKEIVKKEKRTDCKTPHISVHVVLNAHQDIFIKEGRGLYKLNNVFNYNDWQNNKTTDKEENKVIEAQISKTNNTTIIKAYGRMWERNKVDWSKCHPVLLGTPHKIKQYIDFNKMRGIYMLYDTNGTLVYVGLSTNGIGDRLKDHTKDKHANSWVKFSWFGIDGINQDGSIRRPSGLHASIIDVATALESVVLIGVQPARNTRNGERMRDKEYLQFK